CARPGFERPIRQLHDGGLHAKYAKTTRLIICNRARMIEITSMDPHARSADFPSATNRRGEELSADPFPDEVREEPEIRDFDVSFVLALELEVARRRTRYVGDPSLELGTIEIGDPPPAI